MTVLLIYCEYSTFQKLDALFLGRNDRRWHGFEAILPFGFILLYLAIASFGINVSPTICALR